jgi:Curlin associated repeat
MKRDGRSLAHNTLEQMRNRIIAMQSGGNNIAGITQAGAGNYANVSQTGNSNTASVKQR